MRAVGTLSGENVLFCGSQSACCPFTAPSGGQHQRQAASADGGRTDSLPHLSAHSKHRLSTYWQPAPHADSSQQPKIHWPGPAYLSDRDCRVKCLRQQHSYLNKPLGLRCCELAALVTPLLDVYVSPVACGLEYDGSREKMARKSFIVLQEFIPVDLRWLP